MTLLEIEAFLAIIECNSFSAAAKKLYITQPALTRRIQIMEKELGYSLFLRRKGYKEIELTDYGREFYHIAWKWQRLWEETEAISIADKKEMISIASIDSLNHNIFPDIFQTLTEQGVLLRLYNAFSEDAYLYMDRGIYDIAFITLQDYTRTLPVKTKSRPAFSEAFSVITFKELPNNDGVISLDQLSEEKEVYVAWNKEFKVWHAEHFNEQISPVVILEHAALTNYFLKGDRWQLAPYSTCEYYRKQGAYIYELSDIPPAQIVYYIMNDQKTKSVIDRLLNLLNCKLKQMPPNKVVSFLN